MVKKLIWFCALHFVGMLHRIRQSSLIASTWWAYSTFMHGKKGALSKVDVDALDVYFNLTFASTQLTNGKCQREVVERERLKIDAYSNWDFNNTWISCFGCLYMYMVVFLILSLWLMRTELQFRFVLGYCSCWPFNIYLACAFIRACRRSGHRLVV